MIKYHKRHCFLVDFEVSIALMNLVTAVLVEGALDHARQEKETLGVIRGGPWLFDGTIIYGYGSIPINTIFRGMNIHKSQLF